MKKILTVFIFYATTNLLSAQVIYNQYWDKIFGGADGELNTIPLLTSNSNFIFLCKTYSDTGYGKNSTAKGYADYWIVKCDSTGAMIWEYDYGGSNFDVPTKLIKTSDDGYLLAGYTSSPAGFDISEGSHNSGSPSAYDYWILKTDSNGLKQWDGRYGGNNSDILYSACTSHNNDGFLLAGSSNSDSSWDKTQNLFGTIGVTDGWVVKVDNNGYKIWDKQYGGSTFERVCDAKPTTDNGFALIVYSRSDTGGNGNITEARKSTQIFWGDYWLIKIDSIGNIQWSHRIGGNLDDDPRELIVLNNGYLIGGTTRSDSSGDVTQSSRGVQDYWLVRTDTSGYIIWDKRYGSLSGDIFCSLVQTLDKGFIISGQSNSNNGFEKSENQLNSGTTNDIWILKIDSIGNELWDKTIGGLNSNITFTAATENNLGEIITSCTATIPTGSPSVGYNKTVANNSNGDIWVVKFKMDTLVTVTDNQNGIAFSVYPNPANTILNLEINSLKEEPSKIILENLMGQKIFSKPLQLLQGKNNSVIDVSAFAKGIYFMQIKTKERSYVSKVVKN